MDKNDDKSNDDKKYFFDKVINARYEHIHFYNHWMQMYAIFNGALFVGLYTAKDAIFLRFLIVLLGVVAGWCWHFSSKGFYNWLLSYIKSTKEYEKKLGIKDEDSVFNVFYGELNNTKNSKNGKNLKKNPYSTQKLTQFFTLIVAIFWSILTIYIVIPKEIKEKLKELLGNCSFSLLVLFIVCLIVVICSISMLHHEHLEDDGFILREINDEKNNK